MALKLKGLGRGLDALLMPEPTKVDAPAAGITSLKISDLTAGKYQPRRRFDDASLAELAASIKAQGIMQPIIVRSTGPLGGNDGVTGTRDKPVAYELIAGERRFRAAHLAGNGPVLRTMIGCMMPCALIDAASSARDASSKRRRG